MRPRPSRPHGGRRDHVVLGPLCARPDERPVGYVSRLRQSGDDPNGELAILRWTAQALRVLAPDAFLLAFASTPALSSPEAEHVLPEEVRCSIVPVLEAARMGRRRTELELARANARRLGIRVGVAGHRVSSVGDFDALVVSPRTAATRLDTSGRPLVVVDVDTAADLIWAKEQGADLMEGRAVGEALKVAPVDLRRLRR